jgi:tetratricopeptide (TPR) repeat protein
MAGCAYAEPDWFKYMENSREACAKGNFAESDKWLEMALADGAKYNMKPPRFHAGRRQYSPDSLSGELATLADCYAFWHKYDKAASLFEQAVTISPNKDVPDKGGSIFMERLAGLYTEQGKYADAERLFTQLFQMSKNHYTGTNARFTHKSRIHLADCYAKQGKYAQAKRLYLEDINSLENAPQGLGQWLLPESLVSAGKFYLDRNDVEQANIYFERALSSSKIAGSQLAEAQGHMAYICDKQGNATKSESLYKMALQDNRGLPPDEKITILRNYVDLLKRLGKMSEATEKEALAIALQKQIDQQQNESGQAYTPTIYDGQEEKP